MKKFIILCLALLLCFNPKCINAYAEEVSQVRVIYSTINVYSQNDINTSSIITTLQYNDLLTVISSSQGVDGFEYYLVQLINVPDYTQGYVLKSQVLDRTITSPEKKLDSNASISSECEVYVLNGKNYVVTQTKLSAGTKIKILSGYNANNEFTQIQFADENEHIVTAYIKTSAIKVSGISTTLIGAITIIVTTVSLVFIIFGIGKKKKTK